MTDDEFARLFAEHYGAVLGYGLRRVDPDTARDVAAETFLVAWRRLNTTPEDPRTGCWRSRAGCSPTSCAAGHGPIS